MKRVYFFAEGKAEGTASMKALLGGKGANLAEMTNLGVPVPPGFTITTEACRDYNEKGQILSKEIKDESLQALRHLEEVLGLQFGSSQKPLLVSVRSGSPVSMPGMMDTILNLGLNDQTVKALAKLSEDERFAYDSYRRLIQMYADVVMGMDGHVFNALLDEKKKERNVELDTELNAEDWKDLADQFKLEISTTLSKPFPQDPYEQLWGAVAAVFRSWQSKRAVEYRRIEHIPEHLGTAVNVQSMVFGNMGMDSATGVAFTRDPNTGEKMFFGEYLINAQGEDVVAGIRTPQPINHASLRSNGKSAAAEKTLEEAMPPVYSQLVEVYRKLETHYRDMQDIEFTVQKNKLWLLQTRNGKRTARAAVKIACDLVSEGVLTKNEAIGRISPTHLDQLLHPQFDAKAKKRAHLLTRGLPASPGAATGAVVFSADAVLEATQDGRSTILVRLETSPEDIHGMNLAAGILTARGGMTSHAAVVARGMGRSCVVGCQDLLLDANGKTARIMTPKGQVSLALGDVISIDGTTGEVFLGRLEKSAASLTPEFETLMTWCDEVRRLKVRANADLPEDARLARRFGAQGIGLCRTEHMFFGKERIALFRQMILAEDEVGRRRALEEILPLQRQDFISIFNEMRGLPVTIRLLDPPLHEFLPHGKAEIVGLAQQLRVSEKQIKQKIQELTEVNPMLGLRGCRLGLVFPEIYETQVRAIMEAAVYLQKTEDFTPVPEIMIPLIGHRSELAHLRTAVDKVCREVLAEAKATVPYQIGTMIEIPRAALTADAIAHEADFFSFGTNDLTQMTLGISRDDANRFLPTYVGQGLLKDDPFMVIDIEGVGALVRMAVEKGRQTKPGLRTSICGEHGGDPTSVHFCHEVGLDYVSCSPYRVPIARLAAAQAALENKKA